MAIESVNASAASAATSIQSNTPSATAADQSGKNVQAAAQAKELAQVQAAETEQRVQESIKETSEVSAEELQAAIDRLNELMKDGQRSLAFSVDDELGEVVVKVMDKKTDELIRQIPNEEALKFAKNLEGVLGVIFNDRA